MNLFSPNTDGLNNFYDKERYLFAWRISMGLLFVFIPLVIGYSFISSQAMSLAIGALFVTITSLIYLKLTKKFIPVFWFYTLSSCFLANFSLFYVSELTHYVDFVWITCSILIAFIGLGKKAGLITIILNSIGIFIFYYFFLNDHIQILKQRTDFNIT